MDKVRRVEVEDFRRCIENVDVEHIQYLRLFNFGEPLLHENLTGIFEVLHDQPWRAEVLEISTNAQFCNWEDFGSALQLGLLNRLVVSCDGDGTPKQYEELRPPSKWDKLIEFLRRAKDLRDRFAPELELVTRTIVEDAEAIERWSEILLPLGWEPEFRDWKVLPEAQRNMTGREVLVPQDVCTFVAPSSRFSVRYHGEVNQLYVDASGTVVPCCAHPKAADLGSLMDQSVTELLASPRREAFIKRLETDRSRIPVCNECEFGPPESPGESFRQISPDKAEPVRIIQ